MKKFTKTVLLTIIGILCIPAMIGLAMGVGWTLLGYIWNWKMMVIICCILGLLNIPGILIGWFAKK